MQIPSRRALEMLHALNKLRNYLVLSLTKKSNLKTAKCKSDMSKKDPVVVSFIKFQLSITVHEIQLGDRLIDRIAES